MATRGWEGATEADVRRRQLPLKPSKYRNVKTVIDGQVFDSKKEAAHWQLLRARELAGEITGLKRQVPFNLCCPCVEGGHVVVARYVADFTYTSVHALVNVAHVVDVKGKRTAMYQLKKKWLELQGDIVIEEV